MGGEEGRKKGEGGRKEGGGGGEEEDEGEEGRGEEGGRGEEQLMGLWKCWAQILHESEPMPAFLSSLHVTEPSWLQNRQLNVTDKGSLLGLSVSPELKREGERTSGKGKG